MSASATSRGFGKNTIARAPASTLHAHARCVDGGRRTCEVAPVFMAVLAVIPARLASTRLPEKPLARIAGKPMVVHVYERAKAAKTVDSVVVATDSEKI